MTSPFAATGRRYFENGVSIIPIRPGEKRPGEVHFGEWRGLIGWERYCDRMPTDIEMDVWDSWPDAGICAALGGASGIVAIDLDYGSAEVRAAIESVLPLSPVKKKGAKGYTAFYRYKGEPAKKWRVQKQNVIELLSHGNQTVLPPTVHPDGMAYQWLTPDTLENFALEDLPELPSDFIEQIDKALEPFQEPEDIRSNYRSKGSADLGEDDSYWREINNCALANLENWVADLFPMAKRRGDGSFRVVAHWRNVENANVGITHEGITDWGAGTGHTPIDLVMLAAACDLKTATDWLHDRLPMLPRNIDFSLLIQNMSKKARKLESAAKKNPEAEPYVPPQSKRSEVNFFDCDGVLGMMVRHMRDTAKRDQPILHVGACIAAIGALAGRKYATESNLRTNVYCIGIADSGSGKNHSREVINDLFYEANLAQYLGGNKIPSGAGLLSALHRNPSQLLQIDEFGMFMAAVANSKNAPRHVTEILQNMTELYTSSATIFLGAEYADQKTRARVDIREPNLCLYGMTTPMTFWSSLKSGNVGDGSLARFIPFISEVNYPDANIANSSKEFPKALIDGLQLIAKGGRETVSLGDVMSDPTIKTNPRVVVMDADARALFDDLNEATTQDLRDAEGTYYTSILARKVENAMKIALISAVSFNPINPMIRLKDAQWALCVVEKCTGKMVSEIDKYISDNETESSRKEILEVIRKAGADGARKTQISRGTPRLKRKDRDEFLSELIETGDVALELKATNGRAMATYTAVEFLAPAVNEPLT